MHTCTARRLPPAMLLLLLGVLQLCGWSCAQTLENDTQALLAFKAGGDPGSDLSSWDRALGSPCDLAGWDSYDRGWVGVICHAKGSRVAGVKLAGSHRIMGNVESLAALGELTYLSLSFCGSVMGDVGSLAALTQLTQLGLHGTAVDGSVEPLAALTQLTVLSVGDTSVGGSVEPLATLTQLTGLYVANTDVYGRAAPIQVSIPRLADWGSTSNDFSSCGDWTGTCTAGTLLDSPATHAGRTRALTKLL